MRRILGITVMTAFLVWSATAQTGANTQTTGSASANVQAGQAQASGSAAASSNTAATAGRSGAQAGSSSAVSGSASASRSSQEHLNSSQQGSGQGSSSATASGDLAAGSTLNAVLSHSLDSRKSKPGDQVTATTTQDVKSAGHVVIPKHSRLVGHVTQASAKAKGDANSSLGIVFDKAVLHNGQEVPVHAVLQALAASQASLTTTAPAPEMEPMQPMAPMGAPMPSTAGGRPAGAGLVGSTAGAATTTIGSVAGGVGQTVGSTTGVAGNAVGSTVGATAGVAGNVAGNVGRSGDMPATDASGHLLASSSGVVGLPGLTLQSAASSATQGAVVASSGKNVHLDSGTQMVLRVVSQ